jgi:hypothetical protein
MMRKINGYLMRGLVAEMGELVAKIRNLPFLSL